MRHERFTTLYLSTMVLTAAATGMLGARASVWENPLKGRYLSGAPLNIDNPLLKSGSGVRANEK